jgi:hypothetical protein
MTIKHGSVTSTKYHSIHSPVQEADFAFYTAKQDGYCSIHKDDLNGAIEGLVDESELHYGNWLYTDFA